MHLGTCNRWDRHRAFGFIAADTDIDGIADREIYVHRSGLPKGVGSLEPGQRVEFVTVPPHIAGKPVQARIICIIETSEAA